MDTCTPPEAGFAPRHTSYAYNADGQMTTVTRPDGQQLLLSYEPTGRLDFVTLPTGVVDVSYDAASGRVSAVSAPGGFQSAFGYEGPLVTSIATSGPVAGAIGFSYDADLRLAGRTVAGGAAVAFGYDADGLLTEAGALALGREAASGLLATTAAGTATDIRTRNGYGELASYTAQIGGSVALAWELERDRSGRIVRKTETIGGETAVWEYAYDPERGWLTEVRKDGVPVASYGYDGNGNRTSWSDFWGPETASYDAQDRQLSAGAKAFTYTANGERLMQSEGPETTSYTYDVRGALLGVELPDGIAIEYLVDASGRRIGRQVDGVLTQGWLYAGGLAPVAETDGTGSVRSTFVYGTQGHVPDLIVRDGAAYRVFTDHLGSVRLVVDTASGAIAQRLDYDAFGRITYDSHPGWQPFGFAGGLYDPQTGLVRFGARDYDPETGRWTAKDPIGFGGGSALLYEYCANDPLNHTDPSGKIVPVLVVAGAALWTAVEVGLSIWDAHETYETLSDPSVSGAAKLLAGGLFVAGVVGPGAGYGATDDILRHAPEVGRKLLSTGDSLPNAGGVIRSFVQEGGQTYFRVFSGEGRVGKFLTATRPRSSAWAQEALSLPPQNTAQYVQEVVVPAGTRMQRSRALAVPEWGRFRGGAEQYQLLDYIPVQNFGPGVPLP